MQSTQWMLISTITLLAAAAIVSAQERGQRGGAPAARPMTMSIAAFPCRSYQYSAKVSELRVKRKPAKHKPATVKK